MKAKQAVDSVTYHDLGDVLVLDEALHAREIHDRLDLLGGDGV